MQEITDPEQSINRARQNWERLGRSKKWVQQRMMRQETRNKLTDYWSVHGVTEGKEFAVLTNIIHQEWSDLTVKEHKNIKGLKTQNLRDHMSEAELIFTALAELSTRAIAESVEAEDFQKMQMRGKREGELRKVLELSWRKRQGGGWWRGGGMLVEFGDPKYI